MIRKSDKKPIRVFLQDGENDLDNQFGNWPLANKQMAKALEFKDYDYKLVFGTEAHNGKHGGAIFSRIAALAVARLATGKALMPTRNC